MCKMKNEKGILVTVPTHSGKDVSIGVVMNILRDTGISREEFIELEKSV